MREILLLLRGIMIGMLIMFLVHYHTKHPDYEYFIFPWFILIISIIAEATIKKL